MCSAPGCPRNCWSAGPCVPRGSGLAPAGHRCTYLDRRPQAFTATRSRALHPLSPALARPWGGTPRSRHVRQGLSPLWTPASLTATSGSSQVWPCGTLAGTGPPEPFLGTTLSPGEAALALRRGDPPGRSGVRQADRFLRGFLRPPRPVPGGAEAQDPGQPAWAPPWAPEGRQEVARAPSLASLPHPASRGVSRSSGSAGCARPGAHVRAHTGSHAPSGTCTPWLQQQCWCCLRAGGPADHALQPPWWIPVPRRGLQGHQRLPVLPAAHLSPASHLCSTHGAPAWPPLALPTASQRQPCRVQLAWGNPSKIPSAGTSEGTRAGRGREEGHRLAPRRHLR